MPMIHIWMHEGKDAEYRKQISEGIHFAMIDALGVPDDTWDHVFNELKPGNMVYDRNFAGVPRSDDMVFVHFFLNGRPKEMKQKLFEAVAKEVTERSGLAKENLMMTLTEQKPEDWWALGREVDPGTGLDVRMLGKD